jgi:hypothetical protein
MLFAAMLAAHGAAAQAPSASALLMKHEAALGGREALDRHSSVRLTGTVTVDSGAMKGTVEILRGKPNKFVQKMNLIGLGELAKGYDGTVAWEIELGTPAILTDVDAAAVRSHAQWDHDFLAAVALHVGQVDTALFEGQSAWRVTYASDLGLEIHTFFSRESGLRLANVMNTLTGPTTTIYGDYTEIGGVKIPMKVTTRSETSEVVVSIEKVEFDRVESTALALPPPIKAILRQD